MKLVCGGLAVQASCRGGREVADCLHGVDNEQQSQGHTGRCLKADAEMHDLRKLEHAGFSHISKAYHAEEHGEDIACNHTHKNGCQFQESLGKMVQHSDNHQSENGYHPVLPCTVGGLARAACHVVDGSWVERQTNGKHNRACNQRREELSYLLDGKAYDNGAHAAYNLGSQYGGNAGLLRNGLHAGNVGKAYAQDNRKAGTQMETVLIAYGEELQQGGQGRYNQGSLNQQNPVCRVNACCAGNNNGRRHTAYNHGYYMLKGQGNCLAHFWHTIQIKQGCVLFHCIVCIHFLIASFTLNGYEYRFFPGYRLLLFPTA